MSWLRRLLNTVRRTRLDRDIERELSFHLAERIDELRAQGLSEECASREARRRFGNPLVQIERTRDVDIARWLDALVRNLRYAVRSARRTPGFSATVVLTLAFGIGVNSAVFSAIDAVLLKPLPVPDGDRLVRVLEFLQAETDQETQIAPGRLEDWASRSQSLEALAGYYVEDVSDTTGTFPERVRRAVISPRFLQVWQVAPALGRDVIDIERRVGGPRAVLVSDRYWRTRLGADAHVLARSVRIEGESFSIAGVLPPTFPFPDRGVDLWWPYPVDGTAMANTPANRKQRWYTGIGRLKPGVTPLQAQADLNTVQAGLAHDYRETDAGIAVRVALLKQTIVGSVGGSLWMLYIAVSVLLAIACTNIAALWLSRSAQRRREVALRLSLGASRTAVAGQLFTETGLLSFAGATLGALLAAAASGLIPALMTNLPRRDEIGLDARILIYTSLSGVLVTLLCGMLPAVRSTRVGPNAHGDERTQVGGRHAVQWFLVGVQMALSITLLVAAGLLVRSAEALSRVDPGFDSSGVTAFRVSASWNETANRGRLLARIGQTLERMGAIPGVTNVATTWSLPGVPRRYQTEFSLAEGRATSEPPLIAEWRSVSPDYFTTLRMPIAAGEVCRPPAAEPATTELMVNRRFAERYFPDGTAIGSQLTWETGSQSGRVMGIVGDAREVGMDREPPAVVYACDSAPTPFPWFLARTDGDAASAGPSIRAALKDIDPLRSVYDMAPLERRIDEAYAQRRARTSLLVVFAGSALLLACLGVYATLSYAVSLRRREMSLRLALGAPRAGLVRRIVWEAVRVVGVACLAGLAIAIGLRDVVAGMLYGVSPLDPLTLVLVVTIVVTFASAAALVPAVRAARVEPMPVLRDESQAP